jgi:Sulfotransferase domain
VSTPRLLGLWGPPRSLSTVFLRMMIERGDFLVMHEPFSNLAALGHFDVAEDRATSHDDLMTLLLRQSESGPVFFKDTTEYRYPRVLDDPRILNATVNTFIIRDPADAIASHYAINPGLTLAEVGYENLFEIFTAVMQATAAVPVVIDAADLIASPAGTVRAYCARVGIPFRPEALTWENGERGEWARTARWHGDVTASTGVERKPREYPARIDNDERLADLYRYHVPFYEKLRQHRVIPD